MTMKMRVTTKLIHNEKWEWVGSRTDNGTENGNENEAGIRMTMNMRVTTKLIHTKHDNRWEAEPSMIPKMAVKTKLE